MSNLLIVDDEHSICWGLTRLGEEMGHCVRTASSAEQGLELVAEGPPDCIVLDVRLPGMDGLEALEHFQRRCAATPIIVVTAYGDLNTAVTAVRQGAFDYLVKPFDLEQMQTALNRALAARPFRPDGARRERGGELIGRSAAMQEVFKRIALAAASDISVLLRGESGTGKELAARAIHQHSARADGPLIAVNVAALNPSLAESELFGHVRGAFTGADRDRAGLLVQAHGGTLFLDEVAEIPLGLQVKLLRALDHQEVLPLGGNQPVHSDFRVISATHRDLLADVRRGVFRHDLFFRLCAFELEMPALRHRAEDIPLLVDHFLGRTAGGGASAPAVSREALRELAARPWHGNVRELRNAVEHAVMLARGGTIEPAHFPRPSTVLPPPAGEGSLADALAALVADWAYQKWRGNAAHEDLYQQLLAIVDPPLLAAVLEQHRGNCAAAARTLGMHRITLRKMLDEYGISGR